MATISLSSFHTVLPFSCRSHQFTSTATFHSQSETPLSFPSLVSWRSICTFRPCVLCSTTSALKTLSDAELFTVPSLVKEISGIFPSVSGVYAVYSANGDLQFIGITRNVKASVLSHWNAVPELCCSVKVGLVDDPNKTSLTQAWKAWMEEHIGVTGKIPPGNESGNTTWVRKKPDLRLTPGRNAKLAVPLEELIDRLVKEKKVVAFIKGSRSAPLCGFSKKVIGMLESEGVEFESVDVVDEEHNHGLREALKKYSNWPTFPQVFVKGELVGGCDILSSMYEKGEFGAFFTT